MADITVSWELVQPTARQRPIAYARVDFRVDESLPWTEQDRVDPASVQELVFADVAPGDHFFRVVVVDDAGVESLNPPETSATVDFDAPSDVINLQAVVT